MEFIISLHIDIDLFSYDGSIVGSIHILVALFSHADLTTRWYFVMIYC